MELNMKCPYCGYDKSDQNLVQTWNDIVPTGDMNGWLTFERGYSWGHFACAKCGGRWTKQYGKRVEGEKNP